MLPLLPLFSPQGDAAGYAAAIALLLVFRCYIRRRLYYAMPRLMMPFAPMPAIFAA